MGELTDTLLAALSDEQAQALLKALGVVAGLIAAALGVAKAVITSRSKGQQMLIEREMHNQDIAVEVAEGLRGDLAALRQELRESDERHERREAYYEKRLAAITAQLEACQRRDQDCQRRLSAIERQLAWDQTTERRQPEGGS